MQTALDWQRKLRVRELVADTLRTLARHPLVTVGLAAAVVLLGRMLEDDGYFRDDPLFTHWETGHEWRNLFISQEGLFRTPLLAVLWGLITAWVCAETPREAVRLTTGKARVLALAGGAALFLSALVAGYTFVGIVVVAVLFGQFVPVLVMEDASIGDAFRRGIRLMRDDTWRVLFAATALSAVVGAGRFGIAAIVEAFVPRSAIKELDYDTRDMIELSYDAGFTGLQIAVVLVLSAVTYKKLRTSRMDLNPEIWEEVFR